MQQHFRITGTGGYLPAHVITAEELDRRLGLPAGWTRTHTGVAARRQRAPEENAAEMACIAAREALNAAGRAVGDLDLIIDASTSQQQPIPCNAALVQEALGPAAAGIAAIDVHCSCLSFVAALNTANALCATSQHRCILIVSAETPLDGVNWRDPASACLMGDGAAAAIVERCTPAHACHYRFETYAEFAHVCEIAGGGTRLPSYRYTPEAHDRYRFFMDGPRLHKAASRHLPPMVRSVLAEAGATAAELQVVPHQASGPAIELLARRLALDRTRLHVTIAEHGNLVAAGIPYALHHAWPKLAAGERVMLIGTAAGYSQAAFIFHR